MSRAEKMYGKGSKIVPEEAPEQEKPAARDAKATAGSPEKSVASPKETAHEPDVSGMVALDDVRMREVKDMHTRHEKDRRDMHTRHESEHASMLKRHGSGAQGDKGKSESKGKSGTEPG
jgi:hypothetical protein